MGGYGSGRWGWHTRKTTVEECRDICITRLKDWGILIPCTRTIWWKDHDGNQTASVGYQCDGKSIRLFYQSTWRDGKVYEVDERFWLTTTSPHFGGERYWLRCPSCNRRVGKVYLPPHGYQFRCRHCWDLTYRSCQESHKYDAMYAALAASMQDDYPGMTAKYVERLLKERW